MGTWKQLEPDIYEKACKNLKDFVDSMKRMPGIIVHYDFQLPHRVVLGIYVKAPDGGHCRAEEYLPDGQPHVAYPNEDEIVYVSEKLTKRLREFHMIAGKCYRYSSGRIEYYVTLDWEWWHETENPDWRRE